MSEKCREMPTCSSENSQLVGTECLESSLQDRCQELSEALSLKPQAYLIKTYIAYIRQNMCFFAEVAFSVASQHSSVLFLRSAGSAWQELNEQLSSASFICSKACDIIAEDAWRCVKMRLALPANIPLALLTSSKILPCAHRADMSLDMFEKSKLVRLRKSSIVRT